MKPSKSNIFSGIAFYGLCLSFASCSPANETPTQYTLNFNLIASGTPIAMDETVTNSGNTKYSIDVLRFYIGFPRLVKTDDTEVPISNLLIVGFDKHIPYDLVYNSSFTFSAPAGSYKAVRFGLGIPPTIKDTISHNHFGKNDPLNPTYGMVRTNTTQISDVNMQMFVDSSKAQNYTPDKFLNIRIIEDQDTLNLYKNLEFSGSFIIGNGANHVDNFNLDMTQVFFPDNNQINIRYAPSTDMTIGDKVGINLGIQVNNNFAKAITKQ